MFKTDPAIFVTAVVSSVSTDSEFPTRHSILHLKDSEEKYHTNTSREQLLPGILHPTASKHDNKLSHIGISNMF